MPANTPRQDTVLEMFVLALADVRSLLAVVANQEVLPASQAAFDQLKFSTDPSSFAAAHLAIARLEPADRETLIRRCDLEALRILETSFGRNHQEAAYFKTVAFSDKKTRSAGAAINYSRLFSNVLEAKSAAEIAVAFQNMQVFVADRQVLCLMVNALVEEGRQQTPRDEAVKVASSCVKSGWPLMKAVLEVQGVELDRPHKVNAVKAVMNMMIEALSATPYDLREREERCKDKGYEALKGTDSEKFVELLWPLVDPLLVIADRATDFGLGSER